ncbi:MAG: hypothetical protein ACLQJR_03890 [Stellaceae bacterium]
MAVSLIEQLQEDAADRQVRVSDLLRKALLVASRLEIPNVPSWIEKELSGYAVKDWEQELPPYRIVTGRVMAQNPVRGWQPVMFESEEETTRYAQRPVVDPIAKVEALLESTTGNLQATYPADVETHLRKAIGLPFPVSCHITRASMVGVVEEARNKVFLWSMELGKAGIHGDGTSFTRAEKEQAHGITINADSGSTVTIGVLGEVGEHAVIAAGPHSRAGGIDLEDVRVLVAEIEKHVPVLSLGAEETQELDTALSELKSEGSGKQLEQGRVRQLLGRVTGIVGKAGETIITTGIKAYVEAWMKQHGMS